MISYTFAACQGERSYGLKGLCWIFIEEIELVGVLTDGGLLGLLIYRSYYLTSD